MMRSMMSAVTGLKAQQTAMDVIGNNIANVNTAGFKASTTNFTDLFYQTLDNGSVSINPSEVGYGSQVSTISKNMTSTGATQTGNALDLYIDGEGYFAVNSKADGTGQSYYTRVGNFHTDGNGMLCDTNGNYVEGLSTTTDPVSGITTYNPMSLKSTSTTDKNKEISLVNDSSAPTSIDDTNYGQLTNIQINSDGSITATLGDKIGTLEDGNNQPIRVGLSTFVNPDGLSEYGSSYYISSTSSGTANAVGATTNNNTDIKSGALEMSNVDLAQEFTNMIVTERGFQANSRVITVSDSMLDELVNLKRS